jgi:hypothetical protein
VASTLGVYTITITPREECIPRMGGVRESKNDLLRPPGIEPGAKAWEASILPLYYRRINFWRFETIRRKITSVCFAIVGRPLGGIKG